MINFLPCLALQEVCWNGPCGLCCWWPTQGKAVCHCGCHWPDSSTYDNTVRSWKLTCFISYEF